MKAITFLTNLAAVITLLSATEGHTAEVTTVDFTSVTQMPSSWNHAWQTPQIIAGQGLSLSTSVVYPDFLGTSDGWSIRTQAQLQQDFGILGLYVGEAGGTWIGVVANGDVDAGSSPQGFHVGEVDFDPTEEFVLQLDTFDGRFRLWGWTPGNSPAEGTDPLFDIPLLAPDAFPGIWSSQHGQGHGQPFEALFRNVMFSTEHIPLPPACDFDGDNLCNGRDIDQLMTDAATGGTTTDLNGDGIVNDEDRDEWLAMAGQENGFAGPLLVGDADTDGTVGASDLNALALRWQNPEAFDWTVGNFSVAGGMGINVADLNALALNWQNSSPTAAASQAVPEPSGFGVVILASAIVWVSFRHRTH